MPNIIKRYVVLIDRMNFLVGRATMFLIFAMIGVLFYSSISKTFFFPSLWTLEFAQFLMVSYFLLGGAYSIQLRGHVRMDLLYSQGSEENKIYSGCMYVAVYDCLSCHAALRQPFQLAVCDRVRRAQLFVMATVYVAGEVGYVRGYHFNAVASDRTVL